MTTGEFWLGVVGNLVASAIGFVLGGSYSRYQISKTQDASKQELRRKLVKSFRFNVERLNQMHGQLSSAGGVQVPDYRLDTESVEHILFHGRELFDDERWFDRFNWQRFQLVHINSKVDFLNDFVNLSGISPTIMLDRNSIGHSRYISLVGHLVTTQKEITELIQDYEKSGNYGPLLHGK